MNRLEAALVDAAEFLDGRGIDYMVIGGFANLYWGRPRLTVDLDLKIRVSETAWPGLIEGLRSRFRVLVDDPIAFARETRVVPVESPTGVRIDLVLADLPYELAALQRALPFTVGERVVRICTPEDLILHKIISDRPRDREDVEGVLAARGASLDRGYLDQRVEKMAAGLERPDILDFYRESLRKARPT